MRVKLTFSVGGRLPAKLPINYNHFLASAVYDTLANSSVDFSTMLHNQGFEHNGKKFKLFTFSPLLPEKKRITGEHLIIESPVVTWYVSSPSEEFISHLARGIIQKGGLRIADTQLIATEFAMCQEPEMQGKMSFRGLSPISISTKIEASQGRNALQYCRLEDGFYQKIENNLKRKYELLTGTSAEGLNFEMEFDKEYIAKRGGRISKVLQYKNTRIFTYLAPFVATGSPELMRVGYECGFGDGNSKGLGMVEINN